MRILVIVSDFPKVTETFAVANILHYLSEGHDVQLFHLKPFRSAEIVHAEAAPVVDRAFTFPWFGGPSAAALLRTLARRPGTLAAIAGRMLWAFRAEPRRLAASFAMLPKVLAAGQRAKDAGVEHVNAEFASHPATAAWIIHRVYGSPFSFSAHMHDIFVSQSLLAVKSREAAFVRTVSRYNMDKLANLDGFDAGKLNLVRCGVDLDRFEAAPPAFPEGGRPFEIAFVGALHERKGCHLLLEALATLEAPTPWHLTIVGGGPEERRLRGLAARFPEGQVTFLGPQPSDRVLGVLANAHLVTAPSIEGKGGRSEGIPVVTMEALALERPLISSRLSGIPELVEDGVTGRLTEPGDVPGLRQAILWTMTTYDEALRLGAAGRQRVEEEYDIRKNAAALLALIEGSRP